ncbi:MAG: hypothetical protein LBL74_01220 [Bacteroidales bacterium]|jgi:hypothetical protein|nr:hypothetical protein [Bacteroidales bacterium]
MKDIINKIKVTKANVYLIQRMIEDVCDKYNLGNYFGIISTAVSQAVDLAILTQEDEDRLEFSFDQCVGGMSFCLRSRTDVFSDLNAEGFLSDIIKSLADEVSISEEGKMIEMIFYVTGIEHSVLQNRQSKFKEYFIHNPVAK